MASFVAGRGAADSLKQLLLTPSSPPQITFAHVVVLYLCDSSCVCKGGRGPLSTFINYMTQEP